MKLITAWSAPSGLPQVRPRCSAPASRHHDQSGERPRRRARDAGALSGPDRVLEFREKVRLEMGRVGAVRGADHQGDSVVGAHR